MPQNSPRSVLKVVTRHLLAGLSSQRLWSSRSSFSSPKGEKTAPQCRVERVFTIGRHNQNLDTVSRRSTSTSTKCGVVARDCNHTDVADEFQIFLLISISNASRSIFRSLIFQTPLQIERWVEESDKTTAMYTGRLHYDNVCHNATLGMHNCVLRFGGFIILSAAHYFTEIVLVLNFNRYS